jgi:hypothetical protein
MRSTRTVVILALLGCARTVSPNGQPVPEPTGGSGGGGGTAGTAGADAGMMLPPEADQPGVAPFARLTALEYRNTLRDLLGVTVPADLLGRDFDNWQDGIASGIGRGPNDAERIMTIAIAAAEQAAGNLAPLLPCSPIPAAVAEQEACAKLFIGRFGLRAYRRPLETAEQEGLLALYRAMRGPPSDADFTGAIRLVIEAMLQSPFFVYRWEVGASVEKDGALVRFGPYELASRLSYGLWATMPDEALFTAAAARALQTPEQLEGQARRLLADPRAADLVGDFHAQLLQAADLPLLQKDPSFGYSEALAQSMLTELRLFTSGLIVGANARGTLEELFTSTSTFADAGLARIYGLADAPVTGLAPVKLDPTQRAGILTQTAFLAGNAESDDPSVVQRGLRIWQDLLCQALPVPDITSVPELREPVPGATTRERFQQHDMSPCAGCHQKIDPFGFAFLTYDAVGAYRTTEPGDPRLIDATGSMMLPSGELRWTSAVDLVKKMATLEETRSCMSRQWFRYVMHRKEGPGDLRSLSQAQETFRGASYRLQDLIVGLTRTRAFTHRTPAAGEVLP